MALVRFELKNFWFVQEEFIKAPIYDVPPSPHTSEGLKKCGALEALILDQTEILKLFQ